MASDIPKQYLSLGGRTVLERSLDALLARPEIEQVIVALDAGDSRASAMNSLRQARVCCTVGGATRADSVLAALDVLAQRAGKEDWVLVHDAARPCVSGDDILRLMSAVITSGVGGLLALPVVDTIKRADVDGQVLCTVDRASLWRAQTPQMFRLGQLRSAIADALAHQGEITDEASAMERAGHPVQLVAASARNIKITLPEDLGLAEYYLSESDR